MNLKVEVEHLFRHEYARLVALLVRRFGTEHLDPVEDAVQWALTQAVETWGLKGKPSEPTAWLYRVAHRYLISELRNHQRRKHLLQQTTALDEASASNDDESLFASEIHDAMLRMLFVSCHESLPVESQLVFALKSLCGFNVKEIAIRLFLSEDNVYKRLSRAKNTLKQQSNLFEELSNETMIHRLPSVYSVLYLILTEGYLSSHTDFSIREDLCQEALRLTHLLSDSQCGDNAETDALLALIYLQLARLKGRENSQGALMLLAEQDRAQWDKHLIAVGLSYLAKSAQGDTVSRYHLEAGIAAEHCLAPSFEQTRWDRIIESYDLLEKLSASPMHRLNKSIALAEWEGPEQGVVFLKSMDMPSWLTESYYFDAVYADLNYRCGNHSTAELRAKQAIDKAPTTRIKQLLRERFFPVN